MYPKQHPSTKNPEQPHSRKNLTGKQREELKRAVAERLSKKYGLNNSDLIFGEVANFVNANSNITADGLKNLEESIKTATNQQQQQSRSQQPARQDDEESVKSGISKMSGASNFDAIDRLTQKKSLTDGDPDKLSEMSKTKKLQGTQIRRVENDLAFLDEENEWAAIFKYNKFLFDKEEDLKQQRKIDQVRKMRSDLTAQVEEKKNNKNLEKKEVEGYTQNIVLQMQRYDEREKEKEIQLQLIKDMEKVTRFQQIKDNKARKRFETKEEKNLDSYLMQKVKEELEQEKQYKNFKREHQATVMSKLLSENEDKKEQQRIDAEKERQENIQLMDAYCKLIADQENQREKNIVDREGKMKQFQKLALDESSRDHEDKLGVMDKRRDKYQQRHEKKLDQLEIDQKKKIIDQKQFMKDFLFKQMAEKEQRQAVEKKQFNEQADIWKKDNKEFTKFEEKKKTDKFNVMKTYSLTLKEQMADNASQKKTHLQAMNENEAQLNKQLLKELDDLRVKK